MLLLSIFIACQSTGVLDIRAYGEAFIEEGIASSELEDGWQIEFTSFLSQFENITIADEVVLESIEVALTEPSDGEGQSLVVIPVSKTELDGLTFDAGNFQVAGTASKGDITKEFTWEFSNPQTFGDCEGDIAIEKNESAVFEITIHADHLFYDSLVAETPNLRFDALASADQNDDGVISQEELSQTDVGLYDIGNYDISNMWEWLETNADTLVHANGEGHCFPL